MNSTHKQNTNEKYWFPVKCEMKFESEKYY